MNTDLRKTCEEMAAQLIEHGYQDAHDGKTVPTKACKTFAQKKINKLLHAVAKRDQEMREKIERMKWIDKHGVYREEAKGYNKALTDILALFPTQETES